VESSDLPRPLRRRGVPGGNFFRRRWAMRILRDFLLAIRTVVALPFIILLLVVLKIFLRDMDIAED
jgi:hypothetical protein